MDDSYLDRLIRSVEKEDHGVGFRILLVHLEEPHEHEDPNQPGLISRGQIWAE